jgi:hypothetical protein
MFVHQPIYPALQKNSSLEKICKILPISTLNFMMGVIAQLQMVTSHCFFSAIAPTSCFYKKAKRTGGKYFWK